MAQQSLHYDGGHEVVQETEGDRKGLGYEKLGVIAGFLVGLPIGVGLVDAPLSSAGVPQWLGIAATVIVVAVFTSLGLRAGMALAKRITRGTQD
ncbi:MAG: hypothetical protein EOP38_01725 [Rubrivivax sp.]|nr:MAG: hypothetical protein EOP38_01725 [Rubrivivax sp.]